MMSSEFNLSKLMLSKSLTNNYHLYLIQEYFWFNYPAMQIVFHSVTTEWKTYKLSSTSIDIKLFDQHLNSINNAIISRNCPDANASTDYLISILQDQEPLPLRLLSHMLMIRIYSHFLHNEFTLAIKKLNIVLRYLTTFKTSLYRYSPVFDLPSINLLLGTLSFHKNLLIPNKASSTSLTQAIVHISVALEGFRSRNTVPIPRSKSNSDLTVSKSFPLPQQKPYHSSVNSNLKHWSFTMNSKTSSNTPTFSTTAVHKTGKTHQSRSKPSNSRKSLYSNEYQSLSTLSKKLEESRFKTLVVLSLKAWFSFLIFTSGNKNLLTSCFLTKTSHGMHRFSQCSFQRYFAECEKYLQSFSNQPRPIAALVAFLSSWLSFSKQNYSSSFQSLIQCINIGQMEFFSNASFISFIPQLFNMALRSPNPRIPSLYRCPVCNSNDNILQPSDTPCTCLGYTLKDVDSIITLLKHILPNNRAACLLLNNTIGQIIWAQITSGRVPPNQIETLKHSLTAAGTFVLEQGSSVLIAPELITPLIGYLFLVTSLPPAQVNDVIQKFEKFVSAPDSSQSQSQQKKLETWLLTKSKCFWNNNKPTSMEYPSLSINSDITVTKNSTVENHVIWVQIALLILKSSVALSQNHFFVAFECISQAVHLAAPFIPQFNTIFFDPNHSSWLIDVLFYLPYHSFFHFEDMMYAELKKYPVTTKHTFDPISHLNHPDRLAVKHVSHSGIISYFSNIGDHISAEQWKNLQNTSSSFETYVTQIC